MTEFKTLGRVDLLGSSPEILHRSLRERLAPLPDDTLVLPGHGPSTTIGAERSLHPSLQQLR